MARPGNSCGDRPAPSFGLALALRGRLAARSETARRPGWLRVARIGGRAGGLARSPRQGGAELPRGEVGGGYEHAHSRRAGELPPRQEADEKPGDRRRQQAYHDRGAIILRPIPARIVALCLNLVPVHPVTPVRTIRARSRASPRPKATHPLESKSVSPIVLPKHLTRCLYSQVVLAVDTTVSNSLWLLLAYTVMSYLKRGCQRLTECGSLHRPDHAVNECVQ